MEDSTNSFNTLSINIIHLEYTLQIKISFTSRITNINILLANSNFNFDLNLGTEMVSEPRNDLHIPLNNNDDYISNEEYDANPVSIRYFDNGIEFDDSDWHYSSP